MKIVHLALLCTRMIQVMEVHDVIIHEPPMYTIRYRDERIPERIPQNERPQQSRTDDYDVIHRYDDHLEDGYNREINNIMNTHEFTVDSDTNTGVSLYLINFEYLHSLV